MSLFNRRRLADIVAVAAAAAAASGFALAPSVNASAAAYPGDPVTGLGTPDAARLLPALVAAVNHP